MRTECIVGRNGLCDQIRPWRLDALVDVLTEVAVGPAIESAVADGGDVVRYQVVAEFVAFVHCGPELAGLRLPVESVRIAQAGRKDPGGARGGIDLEDGGASFFFLHAVLGDVAVGSHRHVQLRPLSIRDDVLGPVVIERTAGEVGHFASRFGDAGRAGFIGEGHQGIRVRDIERLADQRHAEGRVQAFEKRFAQFGDAIAIGIAQQTDPVRARRRGAGTFHHEHHHPSLEAAAILGPWRRIGFGDQHIAIGQYMEPARMIESDREGVDFESACSARCAISGPASRRCDIHGRQQRRFRGGKSGIRTDRGGRVGDGRQCKQQQSKQAVDRRVRSHGNPPLANTLEQRPASGAVPCGAI